MLSLAKMMSVTPDKIQNTKVSFRILRATYEIDEAGDLFKRVLIVSKGVTPLSENHYSMFKFYYKDPKKRKDSVNNPTWLHCNCDHFLYNCEVALTARGSSDIHNSNGAAPKIKNPTLVPWLCKHLFAAAIAAVETPAITPKKLTKYDKVFIDEYGLVY